MKIKFALFIGFILIFSISQGQMIQKEKEDSIRLKIEQLKIQAQYELDSVKRIYESELYALKSEGQNSLSLIRSKGETELALLIFEAQQ